MVEYLSGGRIQGILGATVLATTGWTLYNSDHIITGSDGFRLQTGSDGKSIYDFGAGSTIPVNDSWICDFDLLRAASNDHYDHPMLYLGSTTDGHGDPDTNGEVTIQLMAWTSGNTGNSLGAVSAMAMFMDSGGNRTEGNANGTYCQQTGATLYYRVQMTGARSGGSNDAARVLRVRAWSTSADRALDTASNEQTTNREFNFVASSALNDDWDDSDDLRYLIVNPKNNESWWTLKNLKFYNATSDATGTPTKEFTFNDVPAADEKVAITNIPTGTRYEETDTRKIFRYKDGYSGTEFNETFPTTGHGWTLNSTYATISNNTLHMQQSSSDTGGNTARAYKALTTSVTYTNSEKMVIDFDWKRNDDSNTSKYINVVISSAQTGYADPTNGHRQIALIFGETDVRGYFKYNDGSAYESSDGFGSLQPADNTWRYYRMIVSKAASGYTWKVYTSDANRAADTSAEDTLVVDDIPDAWWGSSQPVLAYWQVTFATNQTSGGHGHTLDSYFDNLKITQNSLTVPSKEWKERGTA